MKFAINLATRRYLNLRRLDASLAAVLAVLAVALLFQVREVAYRQAEISRIGSQGEATGGRSGGPPVSEAELKSQANRVAFANALIDRKTFNWLGLLDRLEEVVPTGMALSSIQPDPQQPQMVKIGGVTRSFATLRVLLENMERSRNFSDVFLLSQSQTKVGKTQQGITFTVSCRVTYQ